LSRGAQRFGKKKGNEYRITTGPVEIHTRQPEDAETAVGGAPKPKKKGRGEESQKKMFLGLGEKKKGNLTGKSPSGGKGRAPRVLAAKRGGEGQRGGLTLNFCREKGSNLSEEDNRRGPQVHGEKKLSRTRGQKRKVPGGGPDKGARDNPRTRTGTREIRPG